jgi:hypothetical protein
MIKEKQKKKQPRTKRTKNKKGEIGCEGKNKKRVVKK